MLAVATTPDQQALVEAGLDQQGAKVAEIVEPHPRRRVLLARIGYEEQCETVAVALRAEGIMAVTRPAGGGGLRAWMRDTEPVVISDRLSVSLAWSEHDRRHLRGLVEIGPGGFGSGHHPTTRLLMEVLAERVAGGETVLDVGCGSGILALAALTLGAGHATGTDLKAGAVAATARNARLNGMPDRLVVSRNPLVVSRNPLDVTDGPFDIVLANIARAGTVALAADLVASVAPDGWLAVSGLTPRQCDQVAGFLRPLKVVQRRIDNDWAALVLARNYP